MISFISEASNTMKENSKKRKLSSPPHVPTDVAEQAPNPAVAALTRYCPHPEFSDSEKTDWAVALKKGLDNAHGSGNASALRVFLFHLRKNGENLRKFSIDELSTMSRDQLSTGMAVHDKQKRISDGTLNWIGSFLEHPTKLPEQNDWKLTNPNNALILVAQRKGMATAFHTYFQNIPGVSVCSSDIRELDGTVDCFVSPANTRGNMDGGIDRAFAEHFKWPFGRESPSGSANPLQLRIDDVYPHTQRLPIGESLLVPVEPLTSDEPISDASPRTVRFFLAAPTMDNPNIPLPLGSRSPYEAALAAFRLWRCHNSRWANQRGKGEFVSDCTPGEECRDSAKATATPMSNPEITERRLMTMGRINRVAFPPFGAGYGQVPPMVCAAQIYEAFAKAWTEDCSS
jgi:O-acetyl-ADP-ribose deacetylase (regulator of RNase III)